MLWHGFAPDGISTDHKCYITNGLLAIAADQLVQTLTKLATVAHRSIYS